MLLSAQKGFLSVLIILTTVLAIGATAFLVYISNPGLTSKINPSLSKDKTQTSSTKTENTSSKYPTPVSSTTSSTSNPQKNAFQVLKDKLISPTSNSSQTNTNTPTAFPQPASTSKPNNNPSTNSSPSPNQPTPIKPYSQMDTIKKFP